MYSDFNIFQENTDDVLELAVKTWRKQEKKSLQLKVLVHELQKEIKKDPLTQIDYNNLLWLIKHTEQLYINPNFVINDSENVDVEKFLKKAKSLLDINLKDVPTLLLEAKTLLFVHDNYLYETNFGLFETKAIVKKYKISYLKRSFFYVELLSYPGCHKENAPYVVVSYDYDPSYKVKEGDECTVVTRDIPEASLEYLLKLANKQIDEIGDFEKIMNATLDRYIKLKIKPK